MLIRKENEPDRKNLGAFERIPNELVIAIAQYLEIRDFLSLRLTTSELYKAGEDEILWRYYFNKYFPNTIFTENFLHQSFKENLKDKLTELKKDVGDSLVKTFFNFIDLPTNVDKKLVKERLQKVLTKKVIFSPKFNSLLKFCRKYQHQSLLDLIFLQIKELIKTKKLDAIHLPNIAILCNQIEWIKNYALENDKKINEPILNNYTVLHLACLADNRDVISILLAAGANLSRKVGLRQKGIKHLFLNELFYSDDDYFTCFLLAIKCDNVELLEFLIEQDKLQAFDPNTLYSSELKEYPFWHDLLGALHIAAFFNASRCIPFLIKHGCLVDLQSPSLWTPLHIAVLRKSKEAVKALLNNNANQMLATAEVIILQGLRYYHIKPTPFCLAFFEGANYELAYLLLDHIESSNSIKPNFHSYLKSILRGPSVTLDVYYRDNVAKGYYYFLKGIETLLDAYQLNAPTLCKEQLSSFKKSADINSHLFGHCLATLILKRYKKITGDQHQYIINQLIKNYNLELIKFISNFEGLYLDLTDADRKNLNDFIKTIKEQFSQPYTNAKCTSKSTILTSSSLNTKVNYSLRSRAGLFIQQSAQGDLAPSNKTILIDIVNLIDEFIFLNLNKKLVKAICENLDSIKLLINNALYSNESITDEDFQKIAALIRSKLLENNNKQLKNQFFGASLWNKKMESLKAKIIKKLEILNSINSKIQIRKH